MKNKIFPGSAQLMNEVRKDDELDGE